MKNQGKFTFLRRIERIASRSEVEDDDGRRRLRLRPDSLTLTEGSAAAEEEAQQVAKNRRWRR